MLTLSWVNSLVSFKEARQTLVERYTVADRQNSSIFIWHVICFFDSFSGARRRENRAYRGLVKGSGAGAPSEHLRE
jgi:hypothetical protein